MKFGPFDRNRKPQNSSPAANQDTPSALSLLLHPGIGLKRWALVAGFGVLCIGLGISFLLPIPLSSGFLAVSRYVTLTWLPPLARGLVFLAFGVLFVAISGKRLHGMIIEGALGGRKTNRLLLDLHQYRTRIRGPKVIAIGGGAGLSALLRGMKLYTRNITAVVTVADDGGSSGRLRTQLAIPPPGDARNCLVALSDTEPLMERLMQYRFTNGVGLEGHSFGNLFLAALTELQGGFNQGLEAATQLLGVNGRVLPATLATNVVLTGMTQSGQLVQGESQVSASQAPLKRVWLEPEHLPATPQVMEAVREADIIVIGPGSLYTSIIPNFLVVGLREVLQNSRAPKVFVCNVATQRGETEGYGVAEHLQAFYEHSGITITHLIANTNVEALPVESGQVTVHPERPPGFTGHFVAADVVDETARTRHDSAKLAKIIANIPKRGKTGRG